MAEIEIGIKSRIICGRGKLETLPSIVKKDYKRILIVVDPLIPSNIVQRVTGNMESKGIDCAVYTDFSVRPNSKDTQALTDFIKKGFVQCVIGFGGVAIVNLVRLATFSAETGIDIDDILDGANLRSKNLESSNNTKKIDYLEIPSSIRNPLMFTSLAVVSDSRNRSIKIIDTDKLPSAIIKDPAVFETISPENLAAIPFELLMEITEALCLRGESCFTDALLNSALLKLFSALQKGDNFTVDELSDISLCCDYAYSILGPGSGYYCACTLNSHTGVPLSSLAAILLPHLLEYYFFASPSLFPKIASATGYSVLEKSSDSSGEEDVAREFIEEIRRMIKKSNLPISFSEAGVKKDIFNVATVHSTVFPQCVKPVFNISGEKIADILKNAF